MRDREIDYAAWESDSADEAHAAEMREQHSLKRTREDMRDLIYTMLTAAVLAASVLVIIAAVVYLLTPRADAATFNFQTYADGEDGGYEGGWDEVTGGSLTRDGITVTATGLGRPGSFAFLDAKRAGLGVCSSWSCTSGVPGAVVADDNVSMTKTGMAETLRLMFNKPVTVSNLFLRGSDHPPANGSISINGGLYTVAAGDLTGGPLALLDVASSLWDFTYVGTEFYVASIDVAPVPLPAAAWLLLAGVASIAGLKWRRARA